MPIPLTVQVYGRGTAGVPSTTFPLPDLRDRIDSYTHTISDQFGFESLALSFRCALDEVMDWLQNGLMRSVVVYGPTGRICWEGFLETVSVKVGRKQASISIKDVANHVVILFTYQDGSQGLGAASDNTVSQSIYGTKHRTVTLRNSTLLIASNAATTLGNLLAFPRSHESTDASTGDLGDITIDLTFAGWYAALDWCLLSNYSRTNTASHTQLSTIWLPNFAAINAFLSTDYSGITFTGPTLPEYAGSYITYKQVIEKLIAPPLGDTSNQQIAWGVYENRRFCAVTWAGATPTTLTYLEDAATGVILDRYGNTVDPWDVRPNAMSQVTQLLDTGPPTGSVDAAARKYVARVTCAIQGETVSCTLEPSGADPVAAFIAGMVPSAGGVPHG